MRNLNTVTITLTVTELTEIRRAIGTARSSMLLKDWTTDKWAEDCYGVYAETEDALNRAVEIGNSRAESYVWTPNWTPNGAVIDSTS